MASKELVIKLSSDEVAMLEQLQEFDDSCIEETARHILQQAIKETYLELECKWIAEDVRRSSIASEQALGSK